jgi:hypothetical protein
VTNTKVQTRGPNGHSTIFKRDDGRWHGYVSMGKKSDGRRDRRHVSSQRRSEVVTKVRALEARRDSGSAERSGRTPTVEIWLSHWVENIAAVRVRPRTLDSYQAIIRLHLVPRLGWHRLDRLRPDHCEVAYASMLASGPSPASVLRIHRLLHRAVHVGPATGAGDPQYRRARRSAAAASSANSDASHR